jgi:hypothetical protein
MQVASRRLDPKGVVGTTSAGSLAWRPEWAAIGEVGKRGDGVVRRYRRMFSTAAPERRRAVGRRANGPNRIGAPGLRYKADEGKPHWQSV